MSSTNGQSWNYFVQQRALYDVWFPHLSRSELAVCMALLRHADPQTGDAYPSAEGIAKATGIQIRSIRRALKSTKDKGVVRVIRQGMGRANLTVRRLAADTLPIRNSDAGNTVLDNTVITNSVSGEHETVTLGARKQ